MLRRTLLQLMVAALLVLPGTASAAKKLKVVATVPDLAAIASEIGGEHVSVLSLSLPTQDPHFVDPRPNLILDVAKADAVLLVGLQLETGWLPTLLVGSRNRKVQVGAPGYIDCSAFVPLLQVPQGQISREMGDVHPGGNPHYNFDPRAMIRVAQGIGQRLGQLDPDHRETYAQNAADFEASLRKRLVAWEADLAVMKDHPIIEFHRSWPYLQDWVGFEIVADIEPKPGIPPNPAHMAHVITQAQQRDVHIILQEAYFPANTSELVAEKAGAHVLVLPGGTNFREGQRYEDHIDGVVKQLLTAHREWN